MRPHPAPSARRIATSFCRAAARESCKWATLAQAISRTKPTAPSKTRSSSRTPAVWLASRGRTLMPTSFLHSIRGYAVLNSEKTRCISARACASVTPALRRPITV